MSLILDLCKSQDDDVKLYIDCYNRSMKGDNSMKGKVITHFASEWGNKNHFDYRDLIGKGIALEAPENLY